MIKSKMSIQKRRVVAPKKKPARASKFTKAKKAVSEYMQRRRRSVWISELAEKLKLDLGTLLAVLDELHKEGHIKRLKE